MISRIRKLLERSKTVEPVDLPFRKMSFSQTGEDLLIAFYLQHAGIDQPFYIDVGAHHPIYINNTYLFYLRGCNGINIEPDPTLFDAFPKFRERDKNLCMGISSSESGTASLFQFSTPSLNTFDELEAKRIEAMGSNFITGKIVTPIISIAELYKNFVDERNVDLFSIDIEGLDFEILLTMMKNRQFPRVVCAETLIYEENKKPKKRTNIAEMMLEYGYQIYADTHINTIFIYE